MELLIRECKPKDFYFIGQLIKNELGYKELDMNQFQKRILILNNDADYITFVAVSNNELVGFAGVQKGIAYEFDGVYFRVIALAIKRDYQRKGVGTQLLQYIEMFAEEQHSAAISLNSGLSRIAAHSFYEKNGYEKKGYSFTKKLDE